MTVDVFSSLNGTINSDQDSADRELLQAYQSQLLCGHEDKAIEGFRALLLNASSESTRQEAQRLLISMELRRLAQQSPPVGSELRPPTLQGLSLNSKQQNTFSALTGRDWVSNKRVLLPQPGIVNLEADWEVRIDRSVAARFGLHGYRAEQDAALEFVELATQFPELLGSSEGVLRYAQRLIAEDRPRAAELILLAGINEIVSSTEGSNGVGVFVTLDKCLSFFNSGGFTFIKKLSTENISGQIMYKSI